LSKVGPGPSAGLGRTKVSGPLVLGAETAALLAVEGVDATVVAGRAALGAADAEAEAEGAGAGAGVPVDESPTNQVCSGVKRGGAQGVLLKKPSAFRVKH